MCRKFKNIEFKIHLSDVKCIICTDPIIHRKVDELILIVCQSGIYPISTQMATNLTVSTMTIEGYVKQHKFLEHLELIKEINLLL